jgi:rare lipoprotein A
MYGMTAAHRTLPFGTRVNVHDLENGHDVTVRINDRGPFVEGRIIDLSYAAAQAMHMPGIAQVYLEILGLGEGGAIPGIFAVQVGAFKDRSNAERLKERIESQFAATASFIASASVTRAPKTLRALWHKASAGRTWRRRHSL